MIKTGDAALAFVVILGAVSFATGAALATIRTRYLSRKDKPK